MNEQNKKDRKLSASWTAEMKHCTTTLDSEFSDLEYESLSDEEKVWDRLKHGVRAPKTLGDLIAQQMAEEMRRQIDKEIIAAMSVPAGLMKK